MAVNIVKYAKNVAKSFGYAAVDVMGDLNPAIKSFSESNEELGKELYSAVTDWKGAIKKAKHSIIESDAYEFAVAYKKNLFEDLKNGTFYNKTREDEYAERIGGVSDEQLKSEFDDAFEDGVDLSGWDEGDLASDMFMAETMDDVGNKIAESNAEVTIKSSEYIVKAQKESTRILHEQNNRLFGEALKGMAAINANIGQFSGAIADIAQTHANNSKTFFENTDSKLDKIVEMLDSINKNTSPSNSLNKDRDDSQKDMSFYDIIDANGMPNLKKYFNHIKNNVKKNAGDLGMLGDMFGSGENVLMAFAASPLQEMTKSIVQQVIPNVLEKSFEQFNDTLQGFFGSAISKLNRQKDSDNTILSWAAKILGIDGEFRPNLDISRYEKGKVPWDGASRKALVEIIPAQLSKIVSALTGEVPSVFNPDTGRMESILNIKDTADSRVQNAANYAGGDVRKLIERTLDDSKMSFESKYQKDNFYKDLNAFFMGAFTKGGIDNKDLKDIYGLGVGTNGSLLTDILDRLGKTPEGRKALLGMNKRILSERDSLNRTYRRMEETGSVESVLESGMFDAFLKKDAEDKEFRKNTGYTGIRGSGISGIFDQIDNYGHSMFYYAQEMFKRQDAIYKFTGFMVDNWGAGGGKGKGKRRSGPKVATDLTDISPDKDALTKSLDYIEKENLKRENKRFESNRDRYRDKNEDYVSGYFSDDEKNRFNMNADAAEYRRRQEEGDAPKNWIDRMLSEKTLKGKLGAVQGGVQTFLTKPLEAFGKMLGAADEKMYKLIYGEANKDLENLGLLGVLRQNIEGFFQKTNDWIDNTILNPLKAKLGMDSNDPFLKKILGEERYDRWKNKMKDGLIGRKDAETGIRSGGVFGDYIQSVKDTAKDAWSWTKKSATEVKDEIGNAFGGVFEPWRSKRSMDTYAMGGEVKKTGVAAVSEGELIIPSELNPFYHGKTDKKKQIKDEHRAVQKFFGNFAAGTASVGRNGFESGSDEDENEISAAIDGRILALAKKRGMNEGTLRYHLRIAQSKITDKDITNRVGILRKEARKVIMTHKKVHDANDGTGNEAKITDFDMTKGKYVTDDGTVRDLQKGEFIKTLKDGTMEKRALGQSFAGDMMDQLALAGKSIKDVYHRYDGRKGNKDPQSKAFDDMVDDLKGNVSSYGGAATAGAGIGAGLGMLVGMPFLGAAVGGAVGLIKKSDGVQKFLFGDDSVDEDGNATKKGGVFSKETQDFIEKKLPGMAKWGLAGMAAGLVLPGGPLVGTMLGAAFSYAKDSQTISDLLFNQEDEHGATIHRGSLKMTRDDFNKKLQKKLPKMGLGAAAGLLIGGPFGMVGNIMLGSALGFASDTEWGKNILFGHKGTELDKNGDPIRHGGLIEHVTDQVKMLFGFGKEETKGLAQFFKEDVMDPITGSIQPIIRSFEVFGTDIEYFGKKIAKGFKKIFGESMGDSGAFLDNKFFRGAKHLTGDLAHGAIGLAKLPLTLPGQLLGGLGNRLERRMLSKGQVDYRTAQERLDRREQLQFKNSMANRYGKVGKKFSNSFKDFGKGRLISGTGELIGALGSGIYQTAAGGISDAIGSIGASGHDLFNTYNNMDEWMANASPEELQEMYQLALTAQNAKKGINEARKNAVEGLRGDIASLKFLNPEDRKKLFKVASKGDQDKFTETLYGLATSDNKELTDVQRDRITNLIGASVANIAGINAKNNDLEGQSKEARKKLRKNKTFGSLFKGPNGINDKALDNFISQLEYEKAAQNGERDAAKEIKDQMEQDKDQHEEVKDLFKVAINVLSAMAANNGVSVGLPYPGAGTVSGVNIDFNKAFAFTGNELSNSESEDGEEETDTKHSKKKDRNGKRKKRKERVQQAQDDGRADVEDVDTDNFLGSHALGGMIGAAIQKNIVTPDGNYLYDVESHEYKAADSETLEKVKRKTNMQNAIIEIPDKIDTLISSMGGNPDTGDDRNDDEDRDKSILGSILDMVGADGKIKDLILGFKNLSWIPMLAGPLLVGGLFSGLLNEPLNSLSQWLQKLLGFDKETTMNTSFSGDGEVGLDDGLKKGLARDILTGMSPHGASKILNWGGKALKKAGETLSGSKKIRGKIGGWITKKLGKISTGAGGLASKAEDFLVNGRDALNKSIFGYENGKFKTAMKDGFDTVDGFIFDNKAQDFVRGADGNILSVADDVAGQYVDNAAKGAKIKGAINTGLDRLTNFSNNMNAAGSQLLDSADDLYKRGKNSFKEIGQTIKSLGKRSGGKAAGEAVESVTDTAAKNADDVSKIVVKFKDWFTKLIEKGKIPASASKACDEAADKIGKEVSERAAKNAAKGSTKKGFLNALKAAGPVGWATTVAFALIDFTSGYNDAEKTFGIEYPTTADRVVCGLIRSLRGIIEGILAASLVGLAVSLALSMIPDKIFTTIFFNTIGEALAPNISEKRKEYADKVDAYNKETGKNYSIEQYETKKKNKKSMGEKILSDIKYQFSAKYRTKNDSGIEEDGTYIDKFMDESTARWTKYYRPMIQSGKIDEDYASVLYMNECLHDSALNLDEARRKDFEQRIAEYKARSDAKEVPKITNDLNGLIKTNSVKKQHVKWYEKAISYTGLPFSNRATRTKTVDYGDGKNADSYIGNYATGGVTERSGYAALSKGEYVVNGKSSLANLIGGLFGSPKQTDYKDYDDLTDVSGVVNDMMSMDSATTNWKQYWAKVDEGVSGSPLSPLKKLMRRIAASLAMPSFALGKVVENVQGMYDAALTGSTTTGSSNSSGSVSSSSSTRSASTSSVSTASSLKHSSSSGGIIGKAISKVKGFFGKLFGKGSGLYGGASSLDGTFISQMGALGNYGDSSYSDEGCAPATAAMFINSINKGGMTLEQAGDYAVKKGYKVKGDGTKEGFFQDIFANNGIPTENVSGKGVLDALKAGKPTVLLGQDAENASKANSPFGKNPHYVLATGLDANGNVIINDPESSGGGTVYNRKILSKVKSAISTKMQGGRSGLHRNIWKRYGGATDTALVKQQAWAFLRQMGASEACAAGIMGNIAAESGYDPAKVEASSGKGHGLVQWTGPMWTSLQNEANNKGVPWTDLNMQLNLLWKQISGSNGAWINTYKGNDSKYGIMSQNNGITDLASFTGATDPIAVAEVFCVRWERPAIKYAHLDTRRQAAKEAYEEFTGKTIAYDGTVDVGATAADGSPTGAADTSDPSNPFGGLFSNLLSKMYGTSATNTIFGSSSSTGTTDATGGVTSTGGTSGGITASDGTIGQNVAVDAANYIGNRYVWGGNDLNNGIDCSGFVQQMYKKHGFDALAKARSSTKGMWADKYGTKVDNDISSLKPGDVMFFSDNGQDSGIHHVGIYVGNNHMIHAQSSNTGIVDTDLANSEKYRSEFLGAERYGAGSGLNQGRIANVAKLFSGASTAIDSGSKILAKRKTDQTEKDATGAIRSITRLTQSNSKDGVGLDSLVTSLDSIKGLLEKLVSNTDAIATIANLITELAGLKKDTGTKSGTKSSSSSDSHGLSESEDELQNMVSILTQLAQA